MTDNDYKIFKIAVLQDFKTDLLFMLVDRQMHNLDTKIEIDEVREMLADRIKALRCDEEVEQYD